MKATKERGFFKSKYGINLWVYDFDHKKIGADAVYVDVKKGHFQEFYNKKTNFFYYVIDGKGTFYLNGKPIKVKPTDLIIVPAKTKVYYLGKMKLFLVSVPPWQEKDEVHVRFIPRKPRAA